MEFSHTSHSYPCTMVPKPKMPEPSVNNSPIKPPPPRPMGSFSMKRHVVLSGPTEPEPTSSPSRISPEIANLLRIELEPIISQIQPILNSPEDADDRCLRVNSSLDMKEGCPPKKRLKIHMISEGHLLEAQAEITRDDSTSSSSSSVENQQRLKKRRPTKLSSLAGRRLKQKRNNRTSHNTNAGFELRRKKSVARPTPGENKMAALTTDGKIATTNSPWKSNGNLVVPPSLNFSTRNNVNQFFGNTNVFCFPLETSNCPFPILRLTTTTLPKKVGTNSVEENVNHHQVPGTSKSGRSTKSTKVVSAAKSSSSLKVIFNGKPSTESICSYVESDIIPHPLSNNQHIVKKMLPRPTEDLKIKSAGKTGGPTKLETTAGNTIPSENSKTPKPKKSGPKSGNAIQWLPDLPKMSDSKSTAKPSVFAAAIKELGPCDNEVNSIGNEIKKIVETPVLQESALKKSDVKPASTIAALEPLKIEPLPVIEKIIDPQIEVQLTAPIPDKAAAGADTKSDKNDHIPNDLPKKEISVTKFRGWLENITSKISIPRIMSGKLNEGDSGLIIDPPSQFAENQQAFRQKFLGKSDSLKELYDLVTRDTRKIRSWMPRRLSARVSPDSQNNNLMKISGAANPVESEDSLDVVAPGLRLTGVRPVQILDVSTEAVGLELKTEGYNHNNISCDVLYNRNNLSTTFSVTPVASMSKLIWTDVKSGLSKRPGQTVVLSHVSEENLVLTPTPGPQPSFFKKIFTKNASWVQTIQGNWSKFKSWVFTRKKVEVPSELPKCVPKRQRRRYISERTDFMDHIIIPGNRKRLAIPRHMYFNSSRNCPPISVDDNQEEQSLTDNRSGIEIEPKTFCRKPYAVGVVSKPALRRKHVHFHTSNVVTRKVHMRRQ